MKRLLLSIVATLATASLYAQSLEGSWIGKLDLGMMSLNLVLNFTTDADGRLSCTMDSPDQGAKGIAAKVEKTGKDSVRVSVPTILATYEGVLKDGELRGTFKQNGYSFPLNLKPGALKRNRPQTPQPPYPYTTEEVSFSNADANAVLAGTLTLPMNYDAKQSVPVVIMVTGSGFQNRDEEMFEHKPFLVIADYLARNGIASLRYDDRGYAKSTGNFATATTLDFMTDAANGIEWLRSQGERFGKVGVIGHSEGSTVAFMLASKGMADFVVSLAGPSVKGDTILARQMNEKLKRQGMSEKMTAQSVNESLGALGNAWQKYFVDFDPATVIAETCCPVMAVYGTKDTQVHPDLNFPVMKATLPKNKKNMLKTYDGLNHLLQHCTMGYADEYAQIEETISTEVLGDIAKWINDVCGDSRSAKMRKMKN